jgi:putative nucleotidyltransferase with HDIG domain
MNGLVDSLAVTDALESRCGEIVRDVVRRLSPSQRTIAAQVLVARFIEQCRVSASDAAWSALPEWVDASCDRYRDVLPASRILVTAIESVGAVLASSAPQSARAYGAMRPALEAALARPRTKRLSFGREAIDEIDVVIDGLLTKLDQSDVLTAEHSRAVASWCARLGARLGGSRAEIAHLSRAGLVHDIGKITTPAHILQAPRRLDDEEMAIMRAHATAGAEIIHEVPLLLDLLPAVRNHHERIDGTGYPDALRSTQIPHIARIVAVADAFNAMIGRRPYRPPCAPSVALERLVEGRGTQFDPDVVDAMIDVVAPHSR